MSSTTKAYTPGAAGAFGVEPEQTLGIVAPLAKKLKAGVRQDCPRRILARRRRSVHFDRLALGFGFAAQASGDSGAQQHIADMLVADAEKLGDLDAVVTGIRERADFVRGS